jgi:electron transport complex protein RnfD
MVAVGGVIAIGLGKHLFGGLGQNTFNPALVGRAVLQATFPVAMTTWVDPFLPGRFSSVLPSALTLPFSVPAANVDAVTQATPLSAWKFERQLEAARELALGMTSGSAGETSAVLILLGGAWLVARGRMSWRIPAAIFAAVALLSWALPAAGVEACPPPLFMLFSGGLMLGAVFMATDLVGSPMTHRGGVIYGVLIGVLVVVIRTWGGMPEGVMYAILLGNAITPHVDRLVRPRVYGTGRAGRLRADRAAGARGDGAAGARAAEAKP